MVKKAFLVLKYCDICSRNIFTQLMCAKLRSSKMNNSCMKDRETIDEKKLHTEVSKIARFKWR